MVAAAPPRRHYHVLAIALTLVLVAAAVLASVEVYSAVRGPAAPAVAPASPLASRVDPGLVDVSATLGYQQAISAGTGMVLAPSGRVITNNHVFEGATSITVTDVGNHRTYQAAVAGYNQSQGIAMLQLAAASGLKTVSPGTCAPGRSSGSLAASRARGLAVHALLTAGSSAGAHTAAT